MRLLRLTLLLAPLLLGACRGDGPAADPDATPADSRADLVELSSYELTMNGVDRYFEANRNLVAALQTMSPAEREAFESLEDADDLSVEGMADRVGRTPAARQAVERAGLSPREYGVIGLAMVQGAMAQVAFMTQPDADPDSLARAMGVNPRNVAFVQEHAQEIAARQQAMAAEMERLEAGE